MLAEKTITEFTEDIASKKPTPGGGGASAMVGAIGIALGDMVGELTVGKKTYADVENEIKELMAKAQNLRKKLLEFVDADAKAFEPLAKAYGIPKDNPDRDKIMEEALKVGCSVPLDIMGTCGQALEIIFEFADKGSRIAISDAGCAAVLCKSALQAASLNVFINTKSMKDRDCAVLIEEEADNLISKYIEFADRIYELVMSKIR